MRHCPSCTAGVAAKELLGVLFSRSYSDQLKCHACNKNITPPINKEKLAVNIGLIAFAVGLISDYELVFFSNYLLNTFVLFAITLIGFLLVASMLIYLFYPLRVYEE